MATTKPSRKSLMSIAVWLASFGACGSAMAGHYEPQYSGGTVHIVHFEHPPRTNPYTYSQWPIFPYVGYGGFGYTGEPGQGTNPNGSVTCSGQITIRFVWVKDNPADVAPSSAVLRVLSKAYAEGENISANSGIGTVGIPSNNTVTATTTLYNVVNNPGEEFTYALAPSASATLSNPPSVPLSQASAHVVVIGELTPVEISVYGSVQVDSERWVLPSQQVFISVAAGQYQLANHIWTILAKNPNEEEPEVYADFATEIEYGEGSPPVSLD